MLSGRPARRGWAMPSSNRYRSLLTGYLRPQWRRVAGLAALLLAGLGADLANPLILRAFIDTARSTAPLDTLLGLAVVFLALALAGQAVSVGEAYVAQNVGLTAT